MTATASPPGRSPLQLPPPPSSPHKPMPAGHRKGSRGGCLGGLTSCFGGSPVADSDAGHPVDQRGRRSSWFTWSKFRKKKKTVPVEPPAGELPPEKKAGDDRGEKAAGRVEKAAGKGGHFQNEEKKEGKQHRRRTASSPAKKPPAAMESLGQRFFEKLRKGNKDKGGPRIPIGGSHKDEVSKSNQRHRRPPPPPQQQHKQQTRLAFLSPKYDAGRGPPARTPPKPGRTAPSRTGRTSAAPATGGTLLPSSPAAPLPQYSKPSPPHAAAASSLGGVRSPKNTPELEPPPSLPAGRNDQLLGLSVMAVVLVMMLLFGRVSAVLFTCLWLYCLPRVRGTLLEPDGGGCKSASGIVLDSGEYKKKVVLEGLLQRDGRRAPALP